MVSARLYIEGSNTGHDSKEDQIRCREAFRKLIERAGLAGRMPRLTACGGRQTAFEDFKTAHTQSGLGDYVGMLIDSEDPVADIEQTWAHLKVRDNWNRPNGAADDQVLFMATCTETWISADRESLKAHYGQHLQESALPPLVNLEERNRHEIQDQLLRATRNCSNSYAKGKRSFDVLGKLDPLVLKDNLPSFARVERVLKAKL
jgi:hypothetical protein